MSGRGRGRPPSRSAQEGASRRSTRHQQQQNAPQPGEAPPHPDLPDQQQPQGHQEHLNTPMAASAYHQIIDPAITGSQDGGMPPPPVPSAKGLRGQFGLGFSRRGAGAAPSIASSIVSADGTENFSSQPEPQSTAPQRGIPGHVFGTPGRAPSIASSADTPSRSAARAKLMAAMLSRLFTAADDLFIHLCSDQMDLDVWEEERRGFKQAFDAYRAHYVPHDGDPVVDPAFVADTMKTSPLRYRAPRVVSAVNLATLLNDITVANAESLLPLLQVWNKHFPESFIGEGEGSDNTDNAMNEGIIEQILMIRTQLSISTLEKLKTDNPIAFHPLEEVAKIWCDSPMSLESVEAFLGNNKDALQLKPIVRADSEAAALARDRNATRFNSICNLLPNQLVNGYALDLSQLHETYPLVEFVDNLRAFVKTYFARVKSLLQQQDFAHSDAASRADSQIRSQLEADTMGFDRAESGAPPVSYNLNSLREMKQLEQQAPSVYSDGHQLAGSYAPAPRIPYPPGFSSPSPALGYVDPSQQGGFQSDGSIYAESAALVTGRKRKAPADGATASGAPAAKKSRQRRKKKDVPEASMGPSSAAAAPGSAPPAASVAPSQYPPLPGTQDEPDFEALSQRTKEISAASRKVKEPQVRSAWVRRDISLLVKAVNTYQCKWSSIEKEIKAGTIPFERPRDQQALRDKARLLKQDFLKADVLLPRGFDLVVLGKKEREAVKGVGKNPDRKEADVDEHGQPINTEFAEGEVAAPAAIPAPLPPVDDQPELQLQSQPEPQPEAQLEPQQAVPEQVAA